MCFMFAAQMLCMVNARATHVLGACYVSALCMPGMCMVLAGRRLGAYAKLELEKASVDVECMRVCWMV